MKTGVKIGNTFVEFSGCSVQEASDQIDQVRKEQEKDRVLGRLRDFLREIKNDQKAIF